MSEETDHDKEDLAALDSVLRKYSASSQEKTKRSNSEGASEISSTLQLPTKSFLQEIQERAEILSCQRERSAKRTLHTIVAQEAETDHTNLDDFVKLIRSAPITEEAQSSSPPQSPAPKLDITSSPEQLTYDYWNTEALTTKHTLWDLEAQESKRHLSDSGSEPTSTEETDTDSDTGSDASEFNFTWELNTELPEIETEESLAAAAEANPRGYFQLDALEDSGPSAGHISQGYFQLSALDDNLAVDMADNGEPPVPVPAEDVEQLQGVEEDGVVALSDDEPVPVEKEEEEEEEVTMEVDDSKKSFKETLGDEKVLDGFIDDVSNEQNTSGAARDEVVSGDETANVPSEDGDWVLLSPSEDNKPMDVEVNDTDDVVVEKDNDVDHQDKRRKTDDEEDEEEEEEKEEETKTEEEKVSEDGEALMEKSKDEVESEEEETDEGITPPQDTQDKDEDDEDKKEEEEEDTVVLRQKPQGAQAVHPQQRYSLPEFAVFDTAKRLDIEMLKSRAKLGKKGALAQRRKPTKPSNLDPSRRQTWMFGDPNDTSHLLDGIDEEAEKGTRLSAPTSINLHKNEDEQTPQKPRKPIGGIGSPMLLAGLGGPAKLKKTPRKTPLEDKPLAVPPQEKSTVKTEPPRIVKPKPARPTPASKPPKPNQPPSWMTNAKPKPRPSEEKPNHEILSAQKAEEQKEEVPRVPTWMQEKRLPPISPRAEEAAPTKETRVAKKPVPVPQWKMDLLKKKKEAETTGKRHSMPPPVAKKPEPGTVPFTTMPQWQVDLAEKKNLRKKMVSVTDVPSTSTTEIEIKDEKPKVPQWKREAAERAERSKKAMEERAKEQKAKEQKIKEKVKEEKAEKEESAPLSPMQTTPTVTIITKKDSSEEEEKKDKPKSPSWKEEANEKTQKNKDTENKAPKVLSKKPLLTPKPKPSAVNLRQSNNDTTPQWKKDLVKKRRTSDWRSRLRSASIDQNNPPSPTSLTNEESNKLNDNENEQNSTSDTNKETKRHTICTITDLPVKIPRNPPPSNVPQWKIELERRNRRLADHLAKEPVPDN